MAVKFRPFQGMKYGKPSRGEPRLAPLVAEPCSLASHLDCNEQMRFRCFRARSHAETKCEDPRWLIGWSIDQR